MSYTELCLSENTTLDCNSSQLSAFPKPVNSTQPGGNPSLWIEVGSLTATVKNIGDIFLAQVVQLCVSLPQNDVPSGTPLRVLRGFEKIALEPGQSKFSRFSLTRRDLGFWIVTAQNRGSKGEDRISCWV